MSKKFLSVIFFTLAPLLMLATNIRYVLELALEELLELELLLAGKLARDILA